MANPLFLSYRKATRESESARVNAIFLFVVALFLLLFGAGAFLACALEGFNQTFWFSVSFPVLSLLGAGVLLFPAIQERKRAKAKKKQAQEFKKEWLKEEDLAHKPIL